MVCLAEQGRQRLLRRQAADAVHAALQQADTAERDTDGTLPPLLTGPGGAPDADGAVRLQRQKRLVTVDHGDAAAQVLPPQSDMGGLAGAAGCGEQIGGAVEGDGGAVHQKPVVGGELRSQTVVDTEKFQIGRGGCAVCQAHRRLGFGAGGEDGGGLGRCDLVIVAEPPRQRMLDCDLRRKARGIDPEMFHGASFQASCGGASATVRSAMDSAAGR